MTGNFREAIRDQQEDLKRAQSRSIERDLKTSSLYQVLHENSGVLVIQGVRRCGKSTLAAILVKDRKALYLNFDDERLAQVSSQELNSLLKAGYELLGQELEVLILDEIQNIAGWELFVNRISKGMPVIVTGSNAKLLSKELSTHLTGRYLCITLYPFSFREYLRYHKIVLPNNLAHLSTKESAEIKHHFNKYSEVGGLPETYKFGERYPAQIYSDIINRDILVRRKVRYTEILRKFAHYLISTSAQQFSLNKLTKHFQLKDPHTLARYLEYIEETYLVQVLSKLDAKLKNLQLASRKNFCIDSGIQKAIGYSLSKNSGSHLEAIIFLELLRIRDYQQNIRDCFFWQNASNEVDFVTRNKKGINTAIQVCFSLENISTKEREIKGLIAFHSALRTKRHIIITDSEEDKIKTAKLTIEVIPAWKWLLSPVV
jgi:hypothetical protein